ncbi:MAG: hypothetical protein WC058_02725 [Phycisphaeraceae bacterium]
MLLYHGTSAKCLDDVLANGICPRCDGVSNWKKAPSRNDMVYLTRGYPFYYAVQGTAHTKVVVFEIDGELIDDLCLYPDEDYIWYVADRTGDRANLTTPQAAEHLEVLQDQWPKSLRMLGNVAHQGAIPAGFITRYCIYEPKARPALSFAITDYSINVMNYLSEMHNLHQLVAWMFGDETRLPWVQDNDKQLRKFWLKESADRTGIEVVVRH